MIRDVRSAAYGGGLVPLSANEGIEGWGEQQTKDGHTEHSSEYSRAE